MHDRVPRKLLVRTVNRSVVLRCAGAVKFISCLGDLQTVPVCLSEGFLTQSSLPTVVKRTQMHREWHMHHTELIC